MHQKKPVLTNDMLSSMSNNSVFVNALSFMEGTNHAAQVLIEVFPLLFSSVASVSEM